MFCGRKTPLTSLSLSKVSAFFTSGLIALALCSLWFLCEWAHFFWTTTYCLESP